VLAAGGAVALAAEAVYDRRPSDGWLLLEAAAALASLAYAWRYQERLRLVPLLGIAGLFLTGWIAVHLALDVRGDVDARGVYHRQGEALLHGHYPRSEYPVGAVLLFALEALLGRGATRVANAFCMIPCQLATVASVWACRTRFAPWLAAVVALWPLEAFLWEFKFDLAPTALLVLGLLLALRGRWRVAGFALGIGTLLKWTPALAVLALAVWLVGGRRFRAARDHVAAFALTVLVVYIPFLAWSPSHVLAAYTRQGGRSITAESAWFLPLHALGLAHLRGHVSFGAGAPRWADVLAIVVQAVVVLAVVAAAAYARSIAAAVALAALAPATFLLANRIFSPQFLVTVLAAWAVAAALTVRSRREQLAVGVLALAAVTANAFVYPYALPGYKTTWQAASAVLFGLGFSLTAWLTLRAGGAGAPPSDGRPER
jgi:hypothetical protein